MNLLIAAADSQDGRLASGFAKTWLPSQSLNVYVIHVLEPPGILSDLNRTIFSDWKKQSINKARRLVGHLAESLNARHVQTRPMVMEGKVKPKLLQFITDHEIEMTVLAPHASSRAKRFLLGSVSETILHNSPTAVAIARGQRRAARRTVLIGLDGSASAQKAAKWLSRSHFPMCRILLVHVEEPPDTVFDRMSRINTELPVMLERSVEARQRRLRHSMEKLGKIFQKQGHGVETVMSQGIPARQILSLAQRYKADVIVLGSRGLGNFERYTLGSVSSKVARHAECSVLIVK